MSSRNQAEDVCRDTLPARAAVGYWSPVILPQRRAAKTTSTLDTTLRRPESRARFTREASMRSQIAEATVSAWTDSNIFEERNEAAVGEPPELRVLA